jgi:hypothetical protein
MDVCLGGIRLREDDMFFLTNRPFSRIVFNFDGGNAFYPNLRIAYFLICVPAKVHDC